MATPCCLLCIFGFTSSSGSHSLVHSCSFVRQVMLLVPAYNGGVSFKTVKGIHEFPNPSFFSTKPTNRSSSDTFWLCITVGLPSRHSALSLSNRSASLRFSSLLSLLVRSVSLSLSLSLYFSLFLSLCLSLSPSLSLIVSLISLSISL